MTQLSLALEWVRIRCEHAGPYKIGKEPMTHLYPATSFDQSQKTACGKVLGSLWPSNRPLAAMCAACLAALACSTASPSPSLPICTGDLGPGVTCCDAAHGPHGAVCEQDSGALVCMCAGPCVDPVDEPAWCVSR